MFTVFFGGEKLAFLDSLPKARIWILTISATLFWKGPKSAPLLEHEKRL
jgi:hypothetical protein